jgi:uncharacterized protein (TIGR02246 family)
MDDTPEQAARSVMEALEAAWNAADAGAWADQFAEDADFVTVQGQYFRGRATIAQGHHAIFTTIYKDSTNRYELLHARPLGDGLILAHVLAALSVPGGSMAGEHQAVFSLVLAREEAGWRIAALHNTFRPKQMFGQEAGIDRFPDHAADGGPPRG